MIWEILIILGLILGIWSAWGTWNNTQSINSILSVLDELTEDPAKKDPAYNDYF